MARKIIKYTVIVILTLLVLLFTAPFIFKPQLTRLFKKELNKRINGTADFSGLDVSLLKSFPKLTVSLQDFIIKNDSTFDNMNYLTASQLDIITNFKTLFKDEIEIYSLSADAPRINILIDSAGKGNFDIFKKDTAISGDTATITYNISDYSIKNAQVIFDDKSSGTFISAKNILHSGKASIRGPKVQLHTTTAADSLLVNYNGIDYIKDATIQGPAVVNIDSDSLLYTFGSDKMLVNELLLNIKGLVHQTNDTTTYLDLKFDAPQADFKKMLRLVPGVYASSLKDIDASGDALLKGHITGNSSPFAIPQLDMQLEVKNGTLKNKSFNEELKNINLQATVINRGSISDSVVIAVKNAGAELGTQKLAFGFTISKPVTDKYLTAYAKGLLDLDKLAAILNLKDIQLKGKVNADVKAAGKINDMTAQRASNIQAEGFAKADNLYISSKQLTWPLQINSGELLFNNAQADFTIAGLNINNTVINGSGNIYNFFHYLFSASPLTGKLNASTPYINLNDWTGASSGNKKGNTAGSGVFVVPANLNLDVNVSADKINSDKLVLSNVVGKIAIKDQAIFFDNIKANALDGSMLVSGMYSSRQTPANPDIALQYKIIKADTRKTFETINTSRLLMPIIKNLTGKFSSELSANGKLGDNLFPITNSLNGFGSLILDEGFLSQFEPIEKIADQLGIEKLKKIAIKEISNKFSFANGRVTVMPFTFKLFGNYIFEVSGTHGFDNTMDYSLVLQVPRKELGKTGLKLVNSLSNKVNDISRLNIKPSENVKFFINLTGIVSKPNIKIQLAETLKSEIDNLKEQALNQAKERIDSTKKQFIDTLKSNAKNSIKNKLGSIIIKKPASSPADSSKPATNNENKEGIRKKLLKGILNKNASDTVKQ